MAINAILMQTGVHIIDMAVCTWYCLMRSPQGEGGCTVIERRRNPPGCCVTLIAGMSKIASDVIWIDRLLEVGLVT